MMILMCSYYVNSTESNLQTLCRNCHLFNISHADVILMQVIKYFRWLDQMKIIKIYEYHVENSFNIKQLENNLNKSVSELVMKLNNKIFLMSFNLNIKKIDLKYWKQNSNSSLSQIVSDQIKHVSVNDLVQNDDLIYALLNVMKNEVSFIT